MAADDVDKKEQKPAPGQEGAETAADENDVAEVDEIQVRINAAVHEAVEAALAEQKDALMRAQAEVQNVRRRCEQDVERAHKFALEKFSVELLSVVDNLERAREAVPDIDNEHVKALYEGVELTLKGLIETLARFRVEPLDPQGEPFDPQLHEAMSVQENGDVEPNTVLAVMQKGYTLHGRVIRPARVMVSKAPQG